MRPGESESQMLQRNLERMKKEKEEKERLKQEEELRKKKEDLDKKKSEFEQKREQRRSLVQTAAIIRKAPVPSQAASPAPKSAYVFVYAMRVER